MSMAGNVAVVLGGGGVVGAAWISGVLAGIAEATGWDARRADLVVGTSAGASVAATLRQGFSPDDHYAQMSGRPLSAAGQRLAGEASPRILDLPEPPAVSLTGWRPAAPRTALASLSRIRNPQPGVTLAALVPTGKVPHRLVGDPIRARQRDRWPAAPTWICAVNLHNGRLAVFGRDASPEPDLASAVEASVAIPGYFEPVDINGEPYVDGGARSVTNVDLVAGLGFDLVVAVTPLTAVPSALRPPGRHLVRVLRSRVLAGEVAAVRSGGTPVLVIQPTAEDLCVLRSSLRAASAPPAAERGFAAARERLACSDAGDARDLLAGVAA